MTKFRTPAKTMTERLDVNYYRPEFIENQRKLDSVNTVKFSQLYVESGIGHTASVEPHYAKDGHGVPFISGKAIKNGKLLIEVAEKIQTKSHKGIMSKSRLKSGYLLIVRKGDVGNACFVPSDAEELNCSSEVMFFQCRKTEDSHYLSAFFNTYHGGLAIERLQRGSLIPGVSLYDIPGLDVLWLSDEARTYIGNKVRQAEQLRERSREFADKINFLISINDIQKALALKELKYNRPRAEELELRFDPKYYNRRAMAVLKACYHESIPIANLIISVNNGFENRKFVDKGFPYITVSDVSSGRLSLDNAPQISSLAQIPDKARIHSCCVLVVRTGSIGTAVKVHREDENASISSHLIRLEFQEESIAAAVAAFLNSQAGSCLLQKVSYGAVQPQVGQNEVLSFPIPKAVLENAEEILLYMNNQEQAIRNLARLIEAAKFLVEALIEGDLKESELKAAQEKLQQGDNSLDQEILSRLTRNGYNVSGEPPLFPDLDALYKPLQEAETSQKVK